MIFGYLGRLIFGGGKKQSRTASVCITVDLVPFTAESDLALNASANIRSIACVSDIINAVANIKPLVATSNQGFAYSDIRSVVPKSDLIHAISGNAIVTVTSDNSNVKSAISTSVPTSNVGCNNG